ncbi:fumarylacetoacetate hydrolase family protein [Pelistega ratti]|uniref:fumarylacetoacetate hydrolase family protein n=1 Tax=Pelistega ratti TaxID=2652177 RepID=UPI00135ACC3A|nr:fumarylacetoacetate hydrolase family protein [Pelistega ratti]
MTQLLFSAPPVTTLPILDETAQFPVYRVFCIGRNYAAHAAEMGASVDKSKQDPFYFLKSAHHVIGHQQTIPFPPETNNFHHEIELVVALDKPLFQATEKQVLEAIYGYAVGFDLTRRDLQAKDKEKSWPWDDAKDFENAAVIGVISPKEKVKQSMDKAQITLSINGQIRQSGNTANMIWSVAELLAYISRFYHLQAGDLIMTGTPEGVGAIQAGDTLLGEIEGLSPLALTIAAV